MIDYKKILLVNFKSALKVWVVFGVISVVINGNFTLQGVLLGFLFSSLYGFGLGFGSGVISSICGYKFDWVSETRKAALVTFTVLFIYTSVVTFAINYFTVVVISNKPLLKLLDNGYLWTMVLTVFMTLGICSFFFAKSFMETWKESIQKEEKLKAENIEAKYDALRNQTDPHFFFNSLNVLSSLVDEDTDMAQKFISELAKLYRYVLQMRNKELAMVSEEISFVKEYVFLQSMRFENSVECRIGDLADVNDSKIPTLALQLLLENVFKHNVISESNKMIINIFHDKGMLIIKNTKRSKPSIVKSNGVGVENLKARYTFFTDNLVEIFDNDEFYEIRLPLIK